MFEQISTVCILLQAKLTVISSISSNVLPRRGSDMEFNERLGVSDILPTAVEAQLRILIQT